MTSQPSRRVRRRQFTEALREQQPSKPGPAPVGVRTATVTNSRVDVTEGANTGFITANNTVADLVQSLVRMRTSTRDIISILRAVKAAGALHADLVVQ